MKISTRATALSRIGALFVAITPIADAVTTTSTPVGVAVSAIVTQSNNALVVPAVAAFGSINVLGLGAGIPLAVTTTRSLNAGTTLSVYGYFCLY